MFVALTAAIAVVGVLVWVVLQNRAGEPEAVAPGKGSGGSAVAAPVERPKTAELTIETNAPNATIMFRRMKLNVGANVVATNDVVEPVEVSAPGYKPGRYWITVDRPTKLNVTLAKGDDSQAADVDTRPTGSGGSGTVPATTVKLSVTSRPSGAEVMLDDKMIGRTPLDTTVPARAGSAVLRLSARGHKTAQREIVTDRDAAISVDLVEIERPVVRTNGTKKSPPPDPSPTTTTTKPNNNPNDDIRGAR